jgi:rod shape-determining protein MreB
VKKFFNRFLKKLTKDVGIDLGTANTLVYIKDHGIVINEPSVVAINTRTDQILAVGHEARDMVGKTPPHLAVIKPLTKGVISDFEVTEKMLRYFINQVHKESKVLIPRPRVVIGVPPEITEVERRAVEDAVFSAGAREVFLVEEPMLAAIGARLPVADSVGNMIVDVGGGTTDIAIISLAGVVTWKSLPIAGDELNKNIINYSRDIFNLLLGERQAETVKIRIGSAVPQNETLSMEMRGRDLLSGLPKEILVTDSQIRDAINRSVRTIVENVKATLEITPPELVADIYERGIILAGGGALLKGLDKLLSNETAIPVRVADDPLTCVVRGAGLLLEDDELLNDVALPLSRENGIV